MTYFNFLFNLYNKLRLLFLFLRHHRWIKSISFTSASEDILTNTMYLNYYLLITLLTGCLLSSRTLLAQQPVTHPSTEKGALTVTLREPEAEAGYTASPRPDSLIYPLVSPIQSLADTAQQRIDSLRQTVEHTLETPKRAEQQVRQQITDQKNVREAKRMNGTVQQESQLTQQAGVNAPPVPTLRTSSPVGGLPDALPRIPDIKLSELQQVSQRGIGRVQLPTRLGNLPSSLPGGSSDFAAGSADRAARVATQHVQKTEEGQLLINQQQLADKLAQQPGTYQQKIEQHQDPAYRKNQARQRLMEKSQDYLTDQPEAIQTGQQRMSKLKRKYSEVQSEQDKYVRAARLSDSAWVTRLVPGLALQIHRGTSPLLPARSFDLLPFMGYRFNTRWSVGVGGTYRLSVDSRYRLVRHRPVYGGRLYAESVVYKGFLVQVAYERLRTNLPATDGSDQLHRTTYGTGLVGLGKQYGISKKVRGNVLLFHHVDVRSPRPHVTRWGIRMGFFWKTWPTDD